MLFAAGLAHSGFGELLLLRLMELESVQGFPALPGSDTLARVFCADTPAAATRTLRTAWHTPTLLGWAFALLLGRYASRTELGAGERFVVRTTAVALSVCAVVWFAGTRGKHPGWAAFLVSAVLCRVAAG